MTHVTRPSIAYVATQVCRPALGFANLNKSKLYSPERAPSGSVRTFFRLRILSHR